MTQAEKLVKIIMPDLLRYLKMKENGEIAKKRLDNNFFPSMYCDNKSDELEEYGDLKCKCRCK